MATFIEVRTDAFAQRLVETAPTMRNTKGVRRPLRGIEIKEDTYASIKVVRSNGKEIPLVDAGGEDGTGGQGRSKLWSNFIIQTVEDTRQEKSQLMETFGDTYVFFFGERPRILNVQGLLFNTLDFNWRTEFWVNYENVLRGTKLVQQNARLYLHWDDIVVEGYVLGATAQDNAEMPYHIPFQFTLFVTNHMYLSAVGSEDYPIRDAALVQPLQTEIDVLSPRTTLKDTLNQSNILGQSISTVSNAALAAGIGTTAASLRAVLSGQQTVGHTVNTTLMPSSNMLTNAIQAQVQAQSITFLQVVQQYFRNQRMGRPVRATPLRTKIRDNIDEYVNSGAVGWSGRVQQDQAAIAAAAAQQRLLQNTMMVEKQVLGTLRLMGVNPIQHGDPATLSPFSAAHSLTVAATSKLPLPDFTKMAPGVL